MAIVFTNLGTSAAPDINTGTNATSYASASWAPPASGLILLFVQSRRAAAVDTPTVSGNSLTWTQIGTTITSATGLSGSGFSLFAANASGSTTGATTIDFGANTQLHCSASFFHADGVDLTGGVAAAFVQVVTNNVASVTTATIDLAAAAHADNRPIAGFMHLFNEATTPRTNWTEADDLAGSGGERGVETQYRSDAFETTASATWTTSSGWAGYAAELKALVAGGTNTPQTVAGTLTTAGAISKATSKSPGGTLTTAGAIAKSIAKAIAGALSPAGALTTARGYAVAVAGTLSASGALVRDTTKSLAGTLTSAGELATQTAGEFLQDVGGTLAMAGTLAKNTGKEVVGTLTSAGAILRAIAKSMAGTLTSGGTLATARGYFLVLAGTLASAGALQRATGKSIGGTLTPNGVISRAVAKAIGGALSFLGTLIAALVGVEIELLDVEISDSALYVVGLTGSAVYTATLTDSAVYTVTLSDTTRS